MKNIDVILGKDHLEDISSAKPIPAIKEIIWNAFDSKSLIVKVLFQECQSTNTIEKIIIQDEGKAFLTIMSHHYLVVLVNLGRRMQKKWRSFFTWPIW